MDCGLFGEFIGAVMAWVEGGDGGVSVGWWWWWDGGGL